MATKSGILIKNSNVFEKMKIAKKIAFDKTGTLFTRISNIEQHHPLSTAYTPQKMWEMIALI
jgi:Cu+-exporting ATPase